MKNFLKSRLVISSFALLLGSASTTLVSAASLSELTADQIAQDATVSYDSGTGVSRVVMGSFEPFEQFDDLAGAATLKSTEQAVSINGRIVSDGALLDLTLIYTTDSNDPFDMRGYERGIFLSRDNADVIRYDNKIVECSENVTELAYGDSYGSNVPFGFLAGVYMALPRYRGHRSVGRYHTPLGGYSSRYYSGGNLSSGYSNYGYRAPHIGPLTGRRHNDTNRRGRHHRDGMRYSDGGDRSAIDRSGRDRAERDRRREGREDRANRDTNIRDRDRGERRGARDRDRDRDRGNRGRNGRDRGQETGHRNRGRVNGLAGMRSDTPRAENHPTGRRIPLNQPLVTRHNRHTQSVTTVKTPPPKVNMPRPQSSTAQSTRPRAERPRSERIRKDRPKKDRNAASRSRESRSIRTERQRLNRSVDRNFRHKNPRASQTKKFKNFYPLQAGFGTYTHPISVRYRCVREENLTVHIPSERLQAARFEGMTVLIMSRDGQETPVYIPPNYIEGYQKAKQMVGGTSYRPDYTPDPYIQDPHIQGGYPLITK